jgi:hypothetical protein
MKPCPICKHDYLNLADSFHVCNKHESWLVVRCCVCGRFGFSDCAGFCMTHGLLGAAVYDPTPGSPDRRNYLRTIGQQGAPLQGF